MGIDDFVVCGDVVVWVRSVPGVGAERGGPILERAQPSPAGCGRWHSELGMEQYLANVRYQLGQQPSKHGEMRAVALRRALRGEYFLVQWTVHAGRRCPGVGE